MRVTFNSYLLINNLEHKIIFNEIYSYIVKFGFNYYGFCEKDAVKECGFSNNSFQLITITIL